MYRILSASKDTYITNRVIRNSFRATDANVGQAGTLDLFKLAGESNYTAQGPFVSGTDEPIELSRLLVKFNLDPLRALTGSILDITHPSFKCVMQLFDVFGGQTVPSNFKLIMYPLSQSFDEGIGRDVIAFEDIDAANFVTASVTEGTTAWHVTGANSLGYAGQAGVDVITGSTSLGDLFVEQTFSDGTGDLSMDVTKVVSATLVGLLPDFGFRLSFSGTQETDDRTRFVKRFASRHVTDVSLRPRILAGFNDSIQDNHGDFEFNVSGTLFLSNYERSELANLVSGTAATEVSGQNSLAVTLKSGSFTKVITASQHTVGSNSRPGLYSASFAVSEFEDTELRNEIIAAQSETFDEIWGSLDGTVGYHTGSLVIKKSRRTTLDSDFDQLLLNVVNLDDEFQVTDVPRFRLFAQRKGFNFVFTKLPVEAKSEILSKAYYRVRDFNTDRVVIPFGITDDITRVSTDADGMYFDIYMNDLPPGRVYAIDIMVMEGGAKRVYESVGGTFKVTS